MGGLQKDKQRYLLAKLVEQKDFVSLPALLQSLGPGFAERTVRRWLEQLVLSGQVVRIGQKRSTQYKALVSEGRFTFSNEVLPAVTVVRAPLFDRQPVSYEANWLEKYQPNVTTYLPAPVIEFLQEKGFRGDKTDLAGTYARKIYDRLLIDLSYYSSRLEGNTYSLLETKRLILEGVAAEDKLEQEKVMILNHKEAIRYLVEKAPQLNILPVEICTLHFLLSDGLVAARESGRIRTHGVRITGSVYMPLEDPKSLQKQMEKICRKAALISNIFEQSFFLLVHIAYLQAFADVNKRTARLSANLPLIKSNLVPLSFQGINQEDYTDAMLSIYENNEVRPLVELYQFSYSQTSNAYEATVKALGFDEVRVRYRNERRKMLHHIIEKGLIGNELKNYMQESMLQNISENARAAFRSSLEEDLKEISPSRIAGLGVTQMQFERWLKKYLKSKQG